MKKSRRLTFNSPVVLTFVIISFGAMVANYLTAGLSNQLLFATYHSSLASPMTFAFIMMTSFTSFREGEIPLTVILVAIIFIGQQVYEGLFVADNISNMAHIVGGIVGAVAGYSANNRWLYYPLSSLNHMLGTDCDVAGMEKALEGFFDYAEERLGK